MSEAIDPSGPQSADNPLPPLMLLGMHRSGTSYVAGWLEKSNVTLGPSFVETGIGNAFGHYEDLEFVNFHRDLLNKNRSHYLVADRQLRRDPSDLATANELVTRRSSGNADQAWGWKDPRTCLFLDLWREIVPAANALCIYRDCAAVCDSLSRRQEKIVAQRSTVSVDRRLWRALRRNLHDRIVLKEKKPVWTTDRLVQSWIRHNQDMIDYIERLPKSSQSLVMSTDFLRSHWQLVLRWMKIQWGYPMADVDPNDGFRSEHYETEPKELSTTPAIDDQMRQISQRLEELQQQTYERLTNN